MKIVCAWCNRGMGEKDGKGIDGVSHSLCEECLAKLMAKVENKSSAEGEQDNKFGGHICCSMPCTEFQRNLNTSLRKRR